MDVSTRQACLAELQKLWAETQEGLRPPSVWISERQAVLPEADSANTPVISAWYLTERSLEQRSAQDFVRFMVIHSGAHWHAGDMAPKPRSAIFNSRSGRGHEIGLATFAPIQGGELIYLDFQWGGTFGRGMWYRMKPGWPELECVRNCWIS